MHFKVALLSILIVILASVEKGTNAETCEEFVYSMMVQQTTLVVPCLKKLGYATGKERKDNLNCVLKCMFIDAGFIQPDGTADFDAAQKMLETIVPAPFREKASAAMGECGVHAAGLEPGEGDCASYGPLADCLIEFSDKMCD